MDKRVVNFLFFVFAVVLLAGCSIEERLDEFINEVREKSTLEELELFVHVLFGDETMEGSLGWIESKLEGKPSWEDDSVKSIEISLIFEYPFGELPEAYEEGVKDYEEGVIYCLIDEIDAGKAYLNVINVARIEESGIKDKSARLRTLIWWSDGEGVDKKERLSVIIEEFRQEEGKWELDTFEDVLFEQIELPHVKRQNGQASMRTGG